jgi:hypothetical protein
MAAIVVRCGAIEMPAEVDQAQAVTSSGDRP